MKIGNIMIKMGFKKKSKENLKHVTFFADYTKDLLKMNFVSEVREHPGEVKISEEPRMEVMIGDIKGALNFTTEKIEKVYMKNDYETEMSEVKVFYVDLEGNKKQTGYEIKL